MKTTDTELEDCARVVDWTPVDLPYCNNKGISVLVDLRPGIYFFESPFRPLFSPFSPLRTLSCSMKQK